MSRSQNHPTLHKTKKRESSVSPATDSIPLIPLNRNGESWYFFKGIYVHINTHAVHTHVHTYTCTYIHAAWRQGFETNTANDIYTPTSYAYV